MRILGLVLVFGGFIALLNNLGFMIPWKAVWLPLTIIFIGLALKHMGCRRCYGFGRFGMMRKDADDMCGECMKWEEGEGECCGKCEEGECKK